MNLLIRAVVTGFGLALGGALFKEARSRIGWAEEDEDAEKKQREKVNAQDGATDPSFQAT